MEVGLFWFQWIAVTVLFFFEFFALDFLSALLDVSLAASLGFEWLYIGFTYRPSSPEVPATSRCCRIWCQNSAMNLSAAKEEGEKR